MAGSDASAARPPIAGLYALTPELADTQLLVARVAAAIAGGAAAIQWRNKLGTRRRPARTGARAARTLRRPRDSLHRQR